MTNKIVLPNEVILGEAAKMIAEGSSVSFTPKGNSMLPFIRGGEDTVVVTSADNVEVGDIVLAVASGRYLMHRVFSIDGDNIVMMGDGNIRGKERCQKSDIIGKVKEIHKGEKVIIPGKGRLWRRLLPIRRYLLWIYRKLWPVKTPKEQIEISNYAE